MIEVEIKVLINNPDEIRKQFELKQGLYKCSLIHEDTYYNMPRGLRDFRKSDEALRIRKSVEFNKHEEIPNKKTKYYLTYKGAKFNKETKTRKELESLIQDGEKIKEILNLLGFRKIFTVKKERELFFLTFKNHQIEALIDFIPILKQYFIEVEYQAETKERISEVQEILFNFLESLGIKRERSIIKSYLELIAEKIGLREK
ncbi:MAG: class IV adenylate cyclase [Promethearchaeota archaeon]